MNFHVLTLFPEFIEAFAANSMIKKGIDKKLFQIFTKNIRDHAINRYGQVDDIPYGGGGGMLFRPEPIFESFDDLNLDRSESKVIYFSPKGLKFDYNYIKTLTNYQNIVLICGHYEGIDQRVIDALVDDEVSVGDYVLTGGELPAMILIDATVRHIEGVINKDSLKVESFNRHLLEYRQYTRPEVYREMKVPDIYLSGHHKKIEEYRLEDSVRETWLKRRDLLELIDDKNLEKIINKIKRELENESG